MKKILVVDDERPISDIIKFNLTKEGYEVVTAFDGREALEQFEVSDERDMETIKNQIRKMGYSPVMKDWESNYAGIVR